MKTLKIFALIFFLLFSVSVSAEFYKYVDENGNIRFTDDINQVPQDQRAKIRSYEESISVEAPEQEAVQENQETSEQQANFPDLSEDDEAEESLADTKARIDTINSEIDREYQELLKEKEQLAEDRKNAKTREEVEKYNEKVERFNVRGQDFMKKQKERDALVEAYNKRIVKENSKNQTEE